MTISTAVKAAMVERMNEFIQDNPDARLLNDYEYPAKEFVVTMHRDDIWIYHLLIGWMRMG